MICYSSQPLFEDIWLKYYMDSFYNSKSNKYIHDIIMQSVHNLINMESFTSLKCNYLYNIVFSILEPFPHLPPHNKSTDELLL